MVHRGYHTILHLTVLSSTMTVHQTELDGALTRYLAHDREVVPAEVKRGMSVPPSEYPSELVCFWGEATGAVNPLARGTYRGFS